ncbi:DAK2 domain-containing protein [Phytohabitans sp. ZYX-F-186]|uniref:DAK2 domain-containing protein n=1 Tax=Phytohabitans maris TaxID=3071409 RepID=A0ABU0ZQ13_9ACTN|nr:DAK2 domain-containing protein [Phytohabitans sp. ZYX-F-186]MDQ7909124.1 DAK2 domain-containing protein [Phytohabitans sp. ZYX-F-186]
MLDTFDAEAVRRWCAAGLESLRLHQHEIDQLNVYPVPDGDTGTNLVLTVASAQQAIANDAVNGGEDSGGVLRLMSRGALLGARGNSGVIVSQILRGMADALADVVTVRGRALAGALGEAAAAARAAVAKPVEGTILTVASAAAEGATATGSDDLDAVARSAAGAAARALARTPEQLPALARAGVVDAGGRGLCVLLDALVAVVTGQAVASAPVSVRGPVTAVRETGSSEYGYEVQYLLDADSAAVARLRATLAGLGDSLVVVGEEPVWNVHVHVNDVGAAIEAGVEAGRPHRITVTRFEDQAAPPALDPDGRGAVVVAAGAGLVGLFSAEGARVIGANPSTAELLDAVFATRAGHVVVLPDDPDTQAVAGAAAREAQAGGVRVSVVPTRSPVQALAALAVRDTGRGFEDDVIAMAEAAGACRYAAVCYAGREALTMAGRCRPGDVLALVEDEVHVIGTDLAQTCRDLLDRMLGGGGELATLLLGADAPPSLGDELRDHLAQRWPFVEVQVYDGGQPTYPLLVGIE